METVEQLTEAVMDIACEQSHGDAELIIADRITKHLKPFVVALLRAKSTIRVWNGMGLSGAAEKAAWDAYQHSPEMKEINEVLSIFEGVA